MLFHWIIIISPPSQRAPGATEDAAQYTPGMAEQAPPNDQTFGGSTLLLGCFLPQVPGYIHTEATSAAAGGYQRDWRECIPSCNQLANVELREGLRRIDKRVFQNYSSLTSIAIPSTVEVIGTKAFLRCNQLANVELREGLERIDERAFEGCTSLESIRIPSTVKFIHPQAFFDCNNLAAIEFWDEIEQLVNEASLPWWNRGVSEAALRTYYFLAQCNIRLRLDQIKFQTWKDNIHAMLQRIPEELEDKNYLQSIASQLANYEHLQEVAPLLELALWKSKISEQTNTKDIDAQLKLQCRFNSLSMAPIIIQNALSFL